MTTFDARVHRALTPEQHDLVDHPEHCSADPRALAGIGRAAGQQVRVRSSADPPAVALFTVSQEREEDSVEVVRMGRDGRKRLGTEDPFAAVVDSVVPRSELTDADRQGGSSSNGSARRRGPRADRHLAAGGEIELQPTQSVAVGSAARYGVSMFAQGLARLPSARSSASTHLERPAQLLPQLATSSRATVRRPHGFRETSPDRRGAPFPSSRRSPPRQDALAGTESVRTPGRMRVRLHSPRNIVPAPHRRVRGGVPVEQACGLAPRRAGLADAVAGVVSGPSGLSAAPWGRWCLRWCLAALRHRQARGASSARP